MHMGASGHASYRALQVAFGADGAPSKALQGFCRKNGVDPAAAAVEGDYVWADVQSGGQSSLEVRPNHNFTEHSQQRRCVSSGRGALLAECLCMGELLVVQGCQTLRGRGWGIIIDAQLWQGALWRSLGVRVLVRPRLTRLCLMAGAVHACHAGMRCWH